MICAIVLAAGRSRRMGTQKMLLPFAGTTVIGHVVDELCRSAVDEVIVVVGREGKLIAAELAGRPVAVATNRNYGAGMLSSVRCGLGAVSRECTAVMVALGDQPAVSSALVDRMIQAFDSTDKGIIVPVHEGRRGHPLLVAARYFDEILTQFDNIGLRALARAHPGDVLELTIGSDAVLSDMDTPEDYRRQVEARAADRPGARAKGE